MTLLLPASQQIVTELKSIESKQLEMKPRLFPGIPKTKKFELVIFMACETGKVNLVFRKMY
jgi:hypothetical protein